MRNVSVDDSSEKICMLLLEFLDVISDPDKCLVPDQSIQIRLKEDCPSISENIIIFTSILNALSLSLERHSIQNKYIINLDNVNTTKFRLLW